jgi:hypothetical protein
MINLLGKEKEVTPRSTPCPTNDILEVERRQATKQVEEEFLQHIQQVLTEPHKEREVDIIKGEEKVFSPSKTKSEGVVDHVNITHQVLEEGIDNTFILENSLFLDEENKEGSWGLDFDGAHSSTGLGAGIVLRSPDNETTLFSYRLEFNCTNNIAEYEALILGINLAIDMNIKTLHVRGDSDLIVSQVNKKFTAKNPRLKQYMDVMWDAIKNLTTFLLKPSLGKRIIWQTTLLFHFHLANFSRKLVSIRWK